MTTHSAHARLVVKAVTPARWADMDVLFSARGSPKHCWCMAWRANQKTPGADSGPGRKKLMKACVDDGIPVGLLGYLDGQPVAWCSLAPFDSFVGLRKPDDAEDTRKVWSVTCFFVRREHRGQGLTRQLLAAAVDHARQHGARLIEGYAVDPDSPSYRHMGFVTLFKHAGFSEVAREGTRRHVMQRSLAPSRSAKR
jgi:GNAT superfamily N-acetyltransferase